MKNKYFSKALFYDERRTMLFTACGILFIFLFNILKFLNMYHVYLRDPEFNPSAVTVVTGIAYVPIFIICIVATAYSYNNKEARYAFMLTQPYGRDAIVITKTTALVGSYALPILLYGVTASILVVSNKVIFGDRSIQVIALLLINLFVLFAMLTFIVMVIQLMEMLFGKNLAAFALPVIIYGMGLADLGITYAATSRKISFLKDIVGRIVDFLIGSRLTDDGSAHRTIFSLLDYLINSSPVVSSLILLLISVAIMLLCIVLNRRIKFENTSNIFMFRFVENGFKILVSIIVVIIVSVVLFLLVYFITSKLTGISTNVGIMEELNIHLTQNAADTILLFLDVVWIVLITFTYRLIGKEMNKRRAA